jgi:hypothetical protein
MSSRILAVTAVVAVLGGWALLADIVPNEVQQPGTQPNEVGNLEAPDKCDNCHGGYSPAVEPAHNWRGSMMANAGRDPIFWATLAVAEQDFDGAGDLCIRCHSPAGWTAGRSTPTDGSALDPKDADGVQCDLCHAMTNPDDGEHLGVQNAPFVANNGGTPPDGYYGSGMYVLWNGSDKLGPYADAEARHQFLESQFHRDNDFCGTCHDVSNPVVGDLAPNNGTQDGADPVIASGVYGAPVAEKAAFNNFPFQYGIVERTFSEFKASALYGNAITEEWWLSLPPELKAGALQVAYDYTSTIPGNTYADGTPRYFNCQTCHMRPIEGAGCNKKGAPIRADLPLHDMTGGNYWIPDAIQYQDQLGLLRLGGGLTTTQIAALDAGKARAMKQLSQAATLSVTGNTVKVVNHTGHKLISGYPEGRRMWLNIKWHYADGTLAREDGTYGELSVNVPGVLNTTVRTILDLHGANTKIYEAHYGMTQAWANKLVNTFGVSPGLVLDYDRLTGTPGMTLGDLATAGTGTEHETFHFVLNNTVIKDNRIPPYGMNYEKARQRNALPVPADQYRAGDVYNYWDDFTMTPPAGAVYATIDLLYQPTSWEYIQFLYLANNGGNPFLADEGKNLLDAWLATGMAEPYVMASATWGSPPAPPVMNVYVPSIETWCVDKRGSFTSVCGTFGNNETVGIVALTTDALTEPWQPVSGSQVFAEIREEGGAVVTSLQGFSDANGEVRMTWKIPRRQAAGNYIIDIVDVVNGAFEYQPPAPPAVFTVQ